MASAPHLHSLEWRDETLGIRHMHVIRAADVDTLWLEVRKVMALVKASKAREATQSSTPAQEPTQAPAATETPEDWCSVHECKMTKRTNATGSWYSHKTADGYCNGKVKGGK